MAGLNANTQIFINEMNLSCLLVYKHFLKKLFSKFLLFLFFLTNSPN